MRIVLPSADSYGVVVTLVDGHVGYRDTFECDGAHRL